MASCSARDPAVAAAFPWRGAPALGRSWPGQVWRDNVKVSPLRRRHSTSCSRSTLWWVFAQSVRKTCALRVGGDMMVKLFMKAASQQHRRCWAAQKKLVIYRILCLLEDRYCTDKCFPCGTSQGLGREIRNQFYFTWYWRSAHLCSNHNKERGKKNQTRNRTPCLCPWKNFHSKVLNKRPSNFLGKPLFSRGFLIFPALYWMKEFKFKDRCRLNLLFLESLSLMSIARKLQQKITKTLILSSCPYVQTFW